MLLNTAKKWREYAAKAPCAQSSILLKLNKHNHAPEIFTTIS
jgi:hypothetical protein